MKPIKVFCNLGELAMGETKIIGLAGKKGSGKDTCAKFLKRNEKEIFKGTVGIYHFADELKETCIKLLGLTREQCYGEDNDKNTLTKIKWEDLPHYEKIMRSWPTGNSYTSRCDGALNFPNGFMTARQILQHVGTEIMRGMNPNCWVEACFKNIQKDNYKIAVIADVRFVSEVKFMKETNAVVIRLTRNILGNDPHASEIDLDNYNGFDVVIDNQKLNIKETNVALVAALKEMKLCA